MRDYVIDNVLTLGSFSLQPLECSSSLEVWSRSTFRSAATERKAFSPFAKDDLRRQSPPRCASGPFDWNTTVL